MRTDTGVAVRSISAVPETLDQALEHIHALNERDWAVLISSEREHAQRRRLVYHARAAVEESRVAFHVSGLSPLGIHVLEELAQQLRQVVPAHQLLGALAAVETRIRCLSVTDTVTSMNAPPVPFLLYLRSWLPGGTYIAELDRRPRAYSAKHPEKALRHIDPAAEKTVVAVARSTDEGARGRRINDCLDQLLEHLHPSHTVELDNPQPQWWGSARAGQVVVAPVLELDEPERNLPQAEPRVMEVPAKVLCDLNQTAEEENR